jgi:hypothetical protein
MPRCVRSARARKVAGGREALVTNRDTEEKKHAAEKNAKSR